MGVILMRTKGEGRGGCRRRNEKIWAKLPHRQTRCSSAAGEKIGGGECGNVGRGGVVMGGEWSLDPISSNIGQVFFRHSL